MPVRRPVEARDVVCKGNGFQEGEERRGERRCYRHLSERFCAAAYAAVAAAAAAPTNLSVHRVIEYSDYFEQVRRGACAPVSMPCSPFGSYVHYYAIFFLGISEVSSVPLVFVDVFKFFPDVAAR